MLFVVVLIESKSGKNSKLVGDGGVGMGVVDLFPTFIPKF